MGCSQGKASPSAVPKSSSSPKSEDTEKSVLLLGSLAARQLGGGAQKGGLLDTHTPTATANSDDNYVCGEETPREQRENWSPPSEIKPQQISAVTAEAGPNTEVHGMSGFIDDEKTKVGARVVADVDIKYDEDLCVPKGTVGTVAFALHRSLWVNWDGLARLDNAVVLASQIRLQVLASHMSELNVQHTKACKADELISAGACKVPLTAGLHIKGSQESSSEVARSAAMQDHAPRANHPAGDAGPNSSKADTLEVKSAEQSEPKSEVKPARKEKSNMCCC